LERHRELDSAWQKIGGMLHMMIQRADDFCRPEQQQGKP
jgi:hypothetical protein